MIVTHFCGSDLVFVIFIKMIRGKIYFKKKEKNTIHFLTYYLRKNRQIMKYQEK